jgi:3-dehydroquinate synthase
LAGFAAATAHRGLRLVRLPTTVLAQNDAGIGVKNGINAFGFKNFIGSFAPPFAVINDFSFLSTLQQRDRIAGVAEAVKVALIREPEFFEWLCAHVSQLRSFDANTTQYMVKKCAELHLAHIQTSGDPFEFGSARPLDFGHWAAHKLESLSAHSLRHGEAVAIGMALDVRYSVEAGLLEPQLADKVLDVLQCLGLPTYHPELESRTQDGDLKVLAGLSEFQEHLGGELSVTLLGAVGETVECHSMDRELVARSVRWLSQRHTGTQPAEAPGAAE